MKNLAFLSCVFFTIVSSGYCQNMVWTDPVPISDQLSDNINISMSPRYGNFTGDLWGVWEKRIDSYTTAIYCRDFNTQASPFVLLSQPNVQYQHPEVLNWLNGDTLFAVIYQTNQNGHWDIYCSKFLNNGTMSAPEPICNSAANEENFKYLSNFGIVWEQDGSIRFKNYIMGNATSGLTTVTLDQGDCHNPVLSSKYCAWEKKIGSETVIKYSSYQYSSSSWSSPQQLMGGWNMNISSAGDSSSLIVWSHIDIYPWRIKAADLSGPTFCTVNDFANGTNFYPAIINVPVVMKGKFPSMPTFISFVADTACSDEIYVNRNFFDTTYVKISNDPYRTNQHPQFFSTYNYMPGYRTVILTWESRGNDYWQLMLTHIDIAVGIDEQASSGSARLENYPNPFSETTTIHYPIEQVSHTTIAIYNTLGERIKTLKDGIEQQGGHSINWDGKDENGNHVKPGIYICCLKINNQIFQRKILCL